MRSLDKPHIKNVLPLTGSKGPCCIVITECPICHECHQVYLSEEELHAIAYDPDGSISRALPDRSANDRELLMTGTCDNCWKKMFGPEDEED